MTSTAQPPLDKPGAPTRPPLPQARSRVRDDGLPPVDCEQLFELSPAAMAVLMPRGAEFIILGANRAYRELVGAPGEMLVGTDLLTGPAQSHRGSGDLQLLRASLQKVVVTRTADALPDLRVVTTQADDGAVLVQYWRAVNSPCFDGNGEVSQILHRLDNVSEQRRTTAALASSEQRYRELFRNSLDGMALTIPDGRIESVNPAFEAMVGFSEDELRRLGRRAFIDEDDPTFKALDEERRRSGRFHGIVNLRRKDGQRIQVEVSNALFRDADDRLCSAFVMRDITAKAEMERESERLTAELKAERQWLQAVLEFAPLGISLIRPDRSLYVNPRGKDILGADIVSEQGLAQYAPRVLLADGRQATEDDLVAARALRGEIVINIRTWICHADGSRTPLLASGAPVRNEDGEIVGAVGVFQDISDQVRAQNDLEQRERQLNAIFELLPVGVWLADENGHIVRTNPAGERIWGGARYVSPSEFHEYKAWWADSGKPVEPHDWAVARALTKGETSVGELLRIQCFDGSFKTVLNSALPLYDRESRFAGVVVVNEDVTRLIDIENALRRAVQDREAMLNVVAHDLRNPLHGAQLNLRVLELVNAAQDRPDVRAQRAVAAMQREFSRMDRLINDLLDIARIDSGTLSIKPGPVNAQRLLAELLETQRSLAEAAGIRIELAMDPDPGAASVWADRERLLQILENLLGNAFKFTPRGGRVCVDVKQESAETVFSVRDTGPGISEEAIPRLFQRFWQASPDRRGAGLGLSIVKGLVDAHGGRIWVESTLGEGTQFHFALPRKPQPPAGADARPS